MVTRGRAQVRWEVTSFFLRTRKESIEGGGNGQVSVAE